MYIRENYDSSDDSALHEMKKIYILLLLEINISENIVVSNKKFCKKKCWNELNHN